MEYYFPVFRVKEFLHDFALKTLLACPLPLVDKVIVVVLLAEVIASSGRVEPHRFRLAADRVPSRPLVCRLAQSVVSVGEWRIPAEHFPAESSAGLEERFPCRIFPPMCTEILNPRYFAWPCAERDTNGDVLWTWTYPSVSTIQQSFVLRKCGLEGEHSSVQPFVYGQLGKTWYYINCTEVFDSDNLPRVAQFALVLWAKDFCPEKYETLCRILSKTYCKTGNPATMLQLYLSVVTRGSCTTEENGTFLARDFESRSNTSGHTNLKVVELNTTSALANYATKAGLSADEVRGYTRGRALPEECSATASRQVNSRSSYFVSAFQYI
uniref:Uncharacterized protein n=1 Tax=Timema shepardi TaxID=629360 RepID=A0A7R9B9U9_TIMSH|nr:unnamed protein product [Timema shepardi]